MPTAKSDRTFFSRQIQRPASARIAALALLMPLTTAVYAVGQGLQISYGSKGVQTLSFNGATLENVGAFPADAFHIWHMQATDLSGNILSSGQYGWGENNNGASWNSQTNTETYDFTWGTISTQFVQNGNNLDIVVKETNFGSSGIIFDGAEIFPLALHFPQDPRGFNGYTQYAITTTDPGISAADFGSGVVTAVVPNESVPMYGGWLNVGSATYAPLMTTTAPSGMATFLPQVNAPVQPGTSLTYTVSLRFTPEGTAANVADAQASFAQTYPSQMTWTDKRIIGTAYLASSPAGNGDVTQPGGYPTNPRRYYNDTTVDITTPTGLKTFQNRILAQAANNVTNARNMNAQGVITWDLEGEEYPQTTSYVCSPDQIAAVAPEMESTISDTTSAFYGQKLDDAYFKTMTNAGLRVGLCLRPQAFTLGSNSTASQVTLSTNQAIIANLEKKARFANTRWGATLFYVDSTVNAAGGTLDPAIFQQVATDLPSFLFIPEESTTRYYAYTAPFYSFIFHTTTGTPASVYSVYPKAFGANLVNDVASGTLAQYTPQLTDSVADGDILMGHADYWQANDPALVSIYAAAGVTTPVATPSPSPAPAQITPVLSWSAPGAVVYGAALTAAQLNATASVAGNLTYSPAAGTVLGAGTHSLTATFIPANTALYKAASATITLTVTKATPVVIWGTPSGITAGTALSATQLNASANVAGTFTYSPAAGTAPVAGTETLTAIFTPGDAADYASATASVPLVVNAPTVPNAATPNLVQDPGFELQPSNVLSGPWSVTGTSAHGVDRNLGNAHSGLNNAYIWDSGNDWNAMQQTVAVKTNTEYVFSAWVRSSFTAPAGYLSVLGNSGIVSEINFGNLPQYSLLTVKFNSGNNTSVTLRAGYWGQNTAQWMQMDDVALRTNLLLDPGFELQSNRALVSPWIPMGSGAIGADVNVGNAHTGANNGFVWDDSTDFNAITQTVAVQPNTTYAFTGWVRSSLSSPVGYFSVDGANGVLNESSFAGLPGYSQQTVLFNSGANTSVRVRAGFWGDNSVQWIQTDDLTLQQTQ